ncbi:hypothetical protein HW555_013762 [Spodoptera exigua]|uniref:Retrotransposon gag domain-containing protein n=1 Tax=Spodoptera exigua TaxID=7107 RepID=A0A835KZH7_SPOEX|nr:hypothetical protein HW555_013762 [Spodoptera exigua]
MWISKVDECAEIYNWNDRQTVHYALPKLVGHAKTWYQGLPTIRHSWKEWKVLLRESFPSTENYAELLTEMLNRRARPGDSLELYYFSKINLLNRCKIFVILGHSFTERPNLRIIKTATDLRFEKVDVSGEVKLLLVTVDDFELDIGGLRAVTVGAKTNYSGSIYIGGSIRGKPDRE